MTSLRLGTGISKPVGVVCFGSCGLSVLRASVRPPEDDGAPFLRLLPESERELDVNMNELPSFRVSFRDGLDHNWLTADLMDWVDGTLTRFEPAFPS